MNNAALTAVRELGTNTIARKYPVVLSFTREFTKGPLVGMTHQDEIGFCAALDAEEWVSTVNRKNKAGKVEYRVIKWSVR